MNNGRPPNPWLPAAPRPDRGGAELLAPVPVPVPESTLGVRPQSGLAADPAGPNPVPQGLALRAVPDGMSNPPWWWVGCHGGAGMSVLARVVPGGREASRAWPIPAPGETSLVVLVARTNAPGLNAARAAARQWASGRVHGVTLLGLAAVADAPGRLPRPLADLVRLVGGGVPKVWFVPWIDALRFDRPLPDKLPKSLIALENELAALRMRSGRPALG